MLPSDFEVFAMIWVSRSVLLLSWLLAMMLTATSPGHCQTETVLHNFKNGRDGGIPYWGLAADESGNLYGTTYSGGLEYGVVFELSPNGIGGWTETVLHSFTGGKDGKNPSGPVMLDSEGNLYGTTQGGGTNGYGVVFELKHVGDGWQEKVLHNFRGGSDGQFPLAGVIRDKAGNLYGTTYNGFNPATVFKLSRSERGWAERVIYRVATSGAGLTMDGTGNIFLATYWTVLKLSKDDDDHWTASVIHTFTGYPKDGYWASSRPVLDRAGNLYGATTEGGLGVGLVYELIRGKDGIWTERVLHYFSGPDGNGPADILLDSAGNIYGTTFWGGEHDLGTVFELTPTQTGGYQHKIVWNFTGIDGLNPGGQMALDHAGNLYGMASKGGTTYNDNYGFGVVFVVSP
jgi:uncharacterized repeat protein (TIGR03803 family)